MSTAEIKKLVKNLKKDGWIIQRKIHGNMLFSKEAPRPFSEKSTFDKKSAKKSSSK